MTETTAYHSFEEIPGTGGCANRRFMIRWVSTQTGEGHEETVGFEAAMTFCTRHGLDIGPYVQTPEEVAAAEETTAPDHGEHGLRDGEHRFRGR